MNVKSIDNFQCKEWLIYKHYAKRVPSISYAFGLFDNLILKGICTYGMPCRVYNNGGEIFDKKLSVGTLELNRLCVDDNLPKNTLSYFVAKTFDLLPKPICLVSYSDPNNFHNGYIYQATNWIYTGICSTGGKSFDYILNGKYIHGRNVTLEYIKNLCGPSYESKLNLYENFEKVGGEIKSQVGKHIYFMFLGSKTIKQKMLFNLKYPIQPYPKGENKRYDSSYKPTIQLQLL